MNYKSLATWTLLGFLTLGTLGCKSKEPSPELLESKLSAAAFTRTIAGHNYKFQGNTITELSSDPDDQAIYGVISDAHGEAEKVKYFADKFKERGVEGIILTGDLPKNEELRTGRDDSADDKLEIKQVIEAAAKTGLPVLVIPGNHERKTDYESALAEVSAKYPNVVDMTQYRVVNGDDVDFVSLPGYQTFRAAGRQFIPDDGFYADTNFIYATGKLRQGLDDAVVLIAHGAGKTNGRIGPATIYNGMDVGDTATTAMMRDNQIPFAVVGHIHEAGGIAATPDGKNVNQGEWAEQFTANFGTLESWRYLDGQIREGMAGILTVKGKQAKYEILVHK